MEMFISIHSLRMEGDEEALARTAGCNISIHSLRMEGDLVISSGFGDDRDFNPLPPHGGRQTLPYMRELLGVFQSTPSAWRETDKYTGTHYVSDFISIHSLRMEGDDVRIIAGIVFCISIHSLRMEGDKTCFRSIHGFCISIHSLRMEGDFSFS